MTGVMAADNAALHIRNKLNVKIYSKQNQLFKIVILFQKITVLLIN